MPTAAETALSRGLEGVVANESAICYVFGEEGRLIYRGYDIHDLADHSTFEETAYLLLKGDLPTREQLKAFAAQLKAAQKLDKVVQRVIKDAPLSANPMNVLRTAVSASVFGDPDRHDNSAAAEYRKAVRLIAQLPTMVAMFHRLRNGQKPLAPRRGLSLAANLLYMTSGAVPETEVEHALDIALILHADHELNASTFAARVIAATLADMHGAVTGAIAALAGPLHGGANTEVMKMLLDIKTPDRAEAWIREALARKQKIMGFGHRVYRTEDPRAAHLRRMSEELGRKAGQSQWFAMQRTIEDLMKRDKGLYCNVDFYSASTYYVMGIPLDLYTPIFAVSRVSGWCAHVLEQHGDNRLIRPRAEYVGAMDRKWVPVRKRGEGGGSSGGGGGGAGGGEGPA
ncbi:MAG: citrate synthase [Gemmatimonadetes bacterium 13_1_40CM_4_69_8]|nr:MAG: citrate synthase [Gemmatimonadetes bacterium 13_1_40CM_4_69_8]